MKLDECLAEVASRLRVVTGTPGLDSAVLLAEVLEQPRSWALAHPDVDLSPPQQAAVMEAVARLEAGEPLPYVLGHWEFHGLDFIVTPQALIPRPETELLVEAALAWLERHPQRRRGLDVGTGSGCIALTLAHNIQDLQMVATDISPAALEVAARNAARLALTERVGFERCDLLPPPGSPPFDLVTANLPYIPTAELHRLPVYGREPSLALDGGVDGLDLIRRLLAGAPDLLPRGGLALLEIEASQGLAALSLAYDAFSEARISLRQDLAGRDRLVRIEL
ncbi:MAG: peptide chain release factor N(5)-glutamine methyltransferase [Chloroflexi bacterium]|nr:peptide chain release factor N(5)-glutamine methyltransferase [Chloroflexota bacterium]